MINAFYRWGKEYDEEYYNKVIQACSLEQDMLQFPQGDLTELGENGISASGGQKMRIALARACYMNADIYLLDSTLAALDNHVQVQILDKCIQQLLHDKTRLIITHSQQVLAASDQVIIMDHGKIAKMAPYQDVKDSFKELIDVSEQVVEKEQHEPVKATIESTLAVPLDEPKLPATKNPATFIHQEDRVIGKLSQRVVTFFFKGFGIPLVVTCIFTGIFAKIFEVLITGWLSIWTANTVASFTTMHYLLVYGGLACGAAIMFFGQAVSFAFGILRYNFILLIHIF